MTEDDGFIMVPKECETDEFAGANFPAKAMTQKVVKDTSLTTAFRFFDRNGTGYLKDKDAENIVACMNQGFSRRQLQSLVKRAADRDGKVQWKKMSEKMETVEYVAPTKIEKIEAKPETPKDKTPETEVE